MAAMTPPRTGTAAAASAWVPVGGALFVSAWGGNQFTPLLVMYKQEGLSNVVVDALLFVYVFGGTMGAGLGGEAAGRADYLEYIVPAMLVMAISAVAQGTAISVAMDMTAAIGPW